MSCATRGYPESRFALGLPSSSSPASARNVGEGGRCHASKLLSLDQCCFSSRPQGGRLRQWFASFGSKAAHNLERDLKARSAAPDMCRADLDR